MDYLAINSTTAVTGKAGFPLATAVVEFMAEWLNLYPHTVLFSQNLTKFSPFGPTRAVQILDLIKF